MTDTKLIGARAYAARRQLRRDAGAILAALETAREWMSWKESSGDWPGNVDGYKLDALLASAEGAADGLYRRIAFMVGEYDGQPGGDA